MKKPSLQKILLLIFSIFFLLIIFFSAENVFASSIGASPPYITNENLLRGSHYEQEIVISRSNPDSSARAVLEIDAPEFGVPSFENWLSFEPGMEFELPKDEERVTIKAKVDVPQDAVLGDYKGYVRLKLLEESEGQVISVPAVRIDVNLTVTDIEVRELEVRLAEIQNVKKGEPLIMSAKVANNGNIRASLSKVEINITTTNNEPLQTVSAAISDEISPFGEDNVEVKFEGINLDLGEYWGTISIYDGEMELFREKVIFRVIQADGELQGSVVVFQDILIGIGIGVLLVISAVLVIFINKKEKAKKKSIPVKEDQI